MMVFRASEAAEGRVEADVKGETKLRLRFAGGGTSAHLKDVCRALKALGG